MPASDAPLVSVIVVNYRGADDTIRCVEELANLDWPRESLEVVVVDNASGDDSVARLRSALPGTTLVQSDRNTGFAGGCNLGARRSRGRYLAFVNNDARTDPQFLRRAIGALEADATIAAVAAKVLDWEGQTVDFVDAALSWYGQGFKLHAGTPASAEFDHDHDVLFGTGSGLVVRADTFAEVGGFDERFFMFFEDVDLGWRLWLLGHRVRYVAGAVVYHKHHASIERFGHWREQYLLERNALFMVYKNYNEENLARVLAPAIALSVHRGVVLGKQDPHELDLEHGAEAGESATSAVSRTVLASTLAVDAFARAFPELAKERQRLQSARLRPDAEILRMFRLPFQPNIDAPPFVQSHDALASAFGVREAFSQRRRIVVATGDTLAPRMAGPAIRAWQIAKALSREHEVKLVTVSSCDLSHPDFEVLHVDASALRRLETWCDVLVFQGFLLHEYPFLRTSKKIIVADIYDPFHLEQLEQARDHGETARRDIVKSSTWVLNDQLLRGDFFMCASEKQRDFWLGQMAALGRVNPAVYDADETLESLIAVVPFGVEDGVPVRTGGAAKGVIPGIAEDDQLILWGGGIYNWFDPLTLIHAMDRLKERCPRARLLFMGIRHPNPNVPKMRMAVAARRLSDDLGLTGKSVFFNEGWVPYDERQNFLLEADVGVSTHLDHVETAFSFRTRILDYFWAGLPIVATAGDGLSQIIEAEGLGYAVPAEDVDALANALASLLEDEQYAANCRKNVAEVAGRFRWSVVLEPLLQFCREPKRAPDLLDSATRGDLTQPLDLPAPPWQGLRGDLRLVRDYWREGGLRLLAVRVRNRLGRIVRGRIR